MNSRFNNSLENYVNNILKECSQIEILQTHLNPPLSLGGDLVIDSLSLVSVLLRIGEKIGVDLMDSGLELHQIQTMGDLSKLSLRLKQKAGKTR